LIWQANPDCQTGSNLGSLTKGALRPPDARPQQPDGAHSSTVGTTSGLQSNKELTNRLDTFHPHVSNPDPRTKGWIASPPARNDEADLNVRNDK
jgi:hypothetical protein